MTDLTSSIYERFLASRATVLANVTPGDSLQGIITTELMDGALCYVKDVKATYRFDKASLVTASGFTVVLPNGVDSSLPGRWVLIEAQADQSYFTSGVELRSAGFAASTGALTINQWAALPTGSSFYQANVGGDYFTINTTTGVVSYAGPARPYLAQIMMSLQCATAEQDLEVGISLGGDLIGATTDVSQSNRAFSNNTTGSESIFLSAQRIVHLPAGGNSVQGIVRNISSGGAILVNRYSMVLIPLN